MPLVRVEAESFRCFSRMSCTLAPGINWFYGPNAVGKTSLLEAVYISLTGRSFRTSAMEACVQSSHEYAHIRLYAEAPEQQITWLRARSGGTRVYSHQEALRRWSDIMVQYPVLFFDTHSHRQFSASVEVRRKFLDWLVFHMQPSYKNDYAQYRKAMDQRMRALKMGEDPSLWEEMMLRYAQAMDSARRLRVDDLCSVWNSGWGARLVLQYEPGYLGDDLRSLWRKERSGDLKRGFVQSGPHRADIAILSDGISYVHRLSLGQQKLMLCELMLAAAEVLWRTVSVKPIWLMDDVGAELDSNTRRSVFEYLYAMNIQTIVTSLEDHAYADYLNPEPLTSLFA